MYAKVIIEYSVKSLDNIYIYRIPEDLRNIICPGIKVSVPFGVQQIAGFVLEILTDIEDNNFVIKDISGVIDKDLILSDELLKVGYFLKEQTLCSLTTAFQSMLPVGLKIKKTNHSYEKFISYIVLNDVSESLEYIEKYPKRVAQVDALKKLIAKNKILKSEISSNVVKSLVDKNLIKVEKVATYRINENSSIDKRELTKEQKQVYDQIILSLKSYKTFLLHGVTGSGKTEIYIKLIEKVIKNGQTAIMLVPEISLTTQIAKRFYEAFGSDVAIMHSALSSGEKYDEYLKMLRGEVHVVVGTRSAIFAPFTNLGIIITDEEDSTSYKQDNNPRYHARDIATFRAQYNNIPLLLASATPSLESKARADKQVYTLLELKNRVGKSILPDIYVVDMEAEMKKRNMIFSDLLKREIEKKLAAKEQIMLLLNRRGFSTYITCSNCGFTYKCPNCDITLTYHKSSANLICHYCGYQKKVDQYCPKCQENALNYYGLGTEKLEENIKNLFPTARVVRMDQDTTKNKGTHAKIINDFKAELYDILVGTQMISKGLDFPKVTLVGVINADTSLNAPDFRANESTYALLSQVAGRSGRSDMPGEVIIQTFNPDNYIIKCVKENRYDKFYNYEMNFRHRLKYPPYYYLVSLKVIGKDYDAALEESKMVKNYLTNHLKSMLLLGPTTASVFKFNNEYRMQIIIKYQKEDNLREILKELDKLLINKKNIRLEIDFNPFKI